MASQDTNKSIPKFLLFGRMLFRSSFQHDMMRQGKYHFRQDEFAFFFFGKQFALRHAWVPTSPTLVETTWHRQWDLATTCQCPTPQY
jgi:hypothetical protein